MGKYDVGNNQVANEIGRILETITALEANWTASPATLRQARSRIAHHAQLLEECGCSVPNLLKDPIIESRDDLAAVHEELMHVVFEGAEDYWRKQRHPAPRQSRPPGWTRPVADCHGGGKTPAPRIPKFAQALGVLAAHPDWTDKKIAETVGCRRDYLAKLPKWKAARAAQKAHKKNLPRGFRNARTGDIDAIAPDSSPDDMKL